MFFVQLNLKNSNIYLDGKSTQCIIIHYYVIYKIVSTIFFHHHITIYF